MSTVIDNRVVSMEFDNTRFEKNVQTSMETLSNLNKTLDNLPDTAGRGLSNLSKAANGIDLSGISSGIDALNNKFSALGIAGQEVIRDITRTAIQFGKNAWNMTFGQITSGGKRRATNITQAKFTLEGMGLDFQRYSDDINYAVDGTAYGFDQAARAASIFASSGVEAGESMKKALRGISGVAAMTNSSYDEIAYIFEQVNGMGKVTGNTLNMISGRGLNAAAALGKALGKTENEIHDMVRKSQIDFNTFAKAMDDAFGEHSTAADNTLSGVTDNIRAQLSKIGEGFYLPLMENNSSLVEMLKTVKGKIKDLRKVTDPFAASLAKNILSLANVFDRWISKIDVKKIEPFFKMLTSFVDGSQITSIVDNTLHAFSEFGKKISPIAKVAKEAFAEIFPKKGIQVPKLVAFTQEFNKMVRSFVISTKTSNEFKRIFKGVFSILSMGAKAIKNIANSLSPFSSILKKVGKTVLVLMADVGDFFTLMNQNYTFSFLDSFRKTVNQFDFGSTFEKIKTAVKDFISFIDANFAGDKIETGEFVEKLFNTFDKIKDAFNKLRSLSIAEFVEKIKNGFVTLKNTVTLFKDTLVSRLESILNAIRKFVNFLSPIIEPIKRIASGVVKTIGGVFDKIADALEEGISTKTLLNLSMFVTIFTNIISTMNRTNSITKSLKGLTKTFEKMPKAVGGLPASIKGSFDSITGAMKEFKTTVGEYQKVINAKMIKEIAIAILILAGAFLVLSSVPSDKLLGTVGAMGELLIGVGGLMKVLGTIKGLNTAMIVSLSTSIIKISLAVLILAQAVKQLDGLTNVLDSTLVVIIFMISFVAVAKAIEVLKIQSFNKVATGMVIMAVAVKILASAMQYFDGMKWDNVIQGLISIVVMLGTLVGAAVLIDKFVSEESFMKAAAGMVIMAVAVKLLASAVQTLGNMDTEALVQGLVAVFGLMAGLGVLGAVITQYFDTGEFFKVSAGFVLLATSVAILAKALETIANIDPMRLPLALGALLVVMGIIVVACDLLNEKLLSAGAGMLLVAVSMLLLVNAVQSLANMAPEELLQGIVGLSVVLAVLAVALKFIQGSIVGAAALLIVSVALIPFAFALSLLTALNLGDLAGTILVLVVALAALTAVCIIMTSAIVGAVALLAISVALLAFGAACAILVALPLDDMAVTLLVVLGALLAFGALALVLTPVIPVMLLLASVMLVLSVSMLAMGGAMALFGVGMQLLASSGVVGASALSIFCDVLRPNLDLLGAAAVTITAFSAALIAFDAALLVAAVSIAACSISISLLAGSMILFSVAALAFSGALLLITAAVKKCIQMLIHMFDDEEFEDMGSTAMDGIANGVKSGIPNIGEAIKEMGKAVIEKIKNFFSKDKGGGQMEKVGANAATGFINGIKSKLADAKAAAQAFGSSFIKKLKSTLRIKSPSRAMMQIGEYTGEGFAIGVKDSTGMAVDAADDMANETLNSMTNALSVISDAMNSDSEPTITPVMDLSQIQNGFGYIDNMFDRNRANSISANFNAGKMAELERMSANQAQMASLKDQLDYLADILVNQPTPEVTANVTLQGDAAGIFRAVQQSNNQYQKMHGRSAFA